MAKKNTTSRDDEDRQDAAAARRALSEPGSVSADALAKKVQADLMGASLFLQDVLGSRLVDDTNPDAPEFVVKLPDGSRWLVVVSACPDMAD